MEIVNIEKNSSGWWAGDGKGNYIHSDGVVRCSTKGPGNKYTGYHSTKKALLTAMIAAIKTEQNNSQS